MTQTQRTYFTVSQAYLGSPLAFEPALGSKELDRLVNDLVPGNGTLQQKRAQVSLGFFNAIEIENLSHPVSRRYNVPQMTFTPSPSTASFEYSSPEASASPAASKSLKRSRTSSSMEPGAKRLPGFSIMTRDGIDITEYASRGPKTKEQRDHAALMRKLKACGPCKRSKQRCDPSHHRVTATASPATTPSSATPSLTSGYSWSQASISPQSSIEDSFNTSPNQKARTIAHAGGEFFSPLFESTQNTSLPTDMSFNDSLDMSFDSLPLQEFDPVFFSVADMDLNFPADWATWDIHTASAQSVSQPQSHSTSTGCLDQSSPSSLESWDAQREHHPHLSLTEHLEQSSQFCLESWDAKRELQSQSSVEVSQLSTPSQRTLGVTTTVDEQLLQTKTTNISRQKLETSSPPFNFDGSFFRRPSGSRLMTNLNTISLQATETASEGQTNDSEQLLLLSDAMLHSPSATSLQSGLDESFLRSSQRTAQTLGGLDDNLSTSGDTLGVTWTGLTPQTQTDLRQVEESTAPLVRLSRHFNGRHYQTMHSHIISEQLNVSGDLLGLSAGGDALVSESPSQSGSKRLLSSSGCMSEICSGTEDLLQQSSEHFEFDLRTVQESRFMKVREYMRTECTMYAAMAILTAGTMLFFPHWTAAMILVLAKTIHFWPNVMTSERSSRRDCKEDTSQGTPEENKTCSVSSVSTMRRNLAQYISSRAVTFWHNFTSKPHTSSLTSTMSRYFNQGNLSRNLPGLRH